MMTYNQLRTFLVVTRTGNLTRAARELNASQPTVSLQLRALQKSLGTALIERRDHGFRLTPAGEKLRRYAEDTLRGLRTLQQDLAALTGSLSGPLAVGITFILSRHALLSAFSRFRAQSPGVVLQFHVDLPEPLFHQLLSNTLDVACYLRVRTPPELIVEPLGDEEFVVIASPQHPLAGRRRITAEELSEHPFVVTATVVFRELLEAKLRATGVVPRTVIEARNYDAVKKLVERNEGYSIHSKSLVAAEVASGQLVVLSLDGPPILGEIVVAFRSRPLISPLTREIVRFLRAELASPQRVPELASEERSAAPPRVVHAGRPGRRSRA